MQAVGASMFMAAIPGALIGGETAERYGRRAALFFGGCSYVIGACMSHWGLRGVLRRVGARAAMFFHGCSCVNECVHSTAAAPTPHKPGPRAASPSPQARC